MKISKILYISMALMLISCSAEEITEQQKKGVLSFATSIERFEGEPITRTNIYGDAFEDGDKIKLKIICPFSTHTELGESTYSASFDGFWLLKWNKDGWTTLTSADGYDINGDYSPSNGPNVFERYLVQPTPYVFTAQTWSEEQIFITGSGTRVEQYSNVFHANQRNAADYKACDVMWAQTIMQTGSYNVHLSFKHVMAALKITIDDKNSSNNYDNAVLTLEGMPDIDQCEIIVGDYYAAKSKVNSNNYGYQKKNACGNTENGTVIGVAQINSSDATTKAIKSVSQTATYTAYKAGDNVFQIIVPPCNITDNATIWLRNGEKRYSMKLDQTSFDAGKMYNVKMSIQ